MLPHFSISLGFKDAKGKAACCLTRPLGGGKGRWPPPKRDCFERQG